MYLLLIHTIYHVWPCPGSKTPTPRIMKFTTVEEAFLLYITMHLFFFSHYVHVVSEKISFCPAPKAPGRQET
jgi:dolichyl-phosphate-mannose--protein O-mannosyl transferase